MTSEDSRPTLFTRFRESARRHPMAVALTVQGRDHRYDELLDLVERLATKLVDAAGRTPRTVGLLAARSLVAYAGYLATLRLGAAIVPLNPSFPAGRNRLMCQAADVELVISDDGGGPAAAEICGPGGPPTIHLDTTGPLPWYADSRLPAPWSPPYRGDPDDIAYLLFTSGSTGTPKGVPIRHRQVNPYLDHCIARYAVGPGCRLSQTFDLTFDPSVFDMFVAWGSGATLVVPQPNDVLTPARFVTLQRITHWFSVPSVISLARRLRGLRPGSMPDLRWSLFAGEQLTLEQARAWREAAPHSVVENIYGPTELTITCVGYRLPADPAHWPRTPNGTVPIGAVYPHLEAVLIDENGYPTDDGELCVRGPQRFDGYLDRTHDTGRFLSFDGHRATVHDRRTAVDDRHWYRTGDRVRACGDSLVHLGRLDDQLKIRGYRIELGEIESVLRRHPAVLDVVVLALPGDDGELDLHALHTGDDPPEGELAALASERLPVYMVPRRYVHMDRFPTNTSGKIDRRRLAEQLSSRA